MASIITVTFNPCIDKSSSVDKLLPDKKLRCESFKNEAGGGGINVARAVKKLGGEPLAVYLAGGYTGILLENLLKAESVKTMMIDTGIDTRENIMIVDKATNLQYRFITPGCTVEECHWQRILTCLEDLHPIDYMVVSGSMQPGFPKDIFERIAGIAKQKHAKLIIDIPAETLNAYPVKNAFILKPNLNELSMLAGCEELQGDEIAAAARSIIEKNICEALVVSLGAAGALLVTSDITEQFMAPPVKRKSTVGAGDSMLGGVVMYLSAGKSIREAVRYGVACGTAATLNEGTQLCRLSDATSLYKVMQDYTK